MDTSSYTVSGFTLIAYPLIAWMGALERYLIHASKQCLLKVKDVTHGKTMAFSGTCMRFNAETNIAFSVFIRFQVA